MDNIFSVLFSPSVVKKVKIPCCLLLYKGTDSYTPKRECCGHLGDQLQESTPHVHSLANRLWALSALCLPLEAIKMEAQIYPCVTNALRVKDPFRQSFIFHILLCFPISILFKAFSNSISSYLLSNVVVKYF